ncbi:MAG TPA: hypothetical protein VIK06_01905 [Candidatus Limnocylindrales bacterium]
MERSIPQGDTRDGVSGGDSAGCEGGKQGVGADRSAPSNEPQVAAPSFGPLQWCLALMAFCLVVFILSNPDRRNYYVHFVTQAQAWLDGRTSIPLPDYQDTMPILNAAGQNTGQGVIPFPPFPALVLLPFVSIWGAATNQQLLATILGAIDVGIAYWMLGFLPIRQAVRGLTALFLGLGTVLWYASALGTTWFFAHVVAVGCLLLAVGLALSADRDAAEPRPASQGLVALRHAELPSASSLVVLALLAALGGLFFALAGTGTTAAGLAALGVLLMVLLAGLAVLVAGRFAVLAPLAVLLALGVAFPAILLAGAHSASVLLLADVIAFAAVAGLLILSFRSPGKIDGALGAFSRMLTQPESRQVAAGVLFGLAVTARLTILFGLPFFLLVGGGGTWLRRGLLAGAGAAIPLVALLVYTFASTGHLFNPAYDYLYHQELGYGTSFGLDYNPSFSIEDIRYIPHNIGIFLLGMPTIFPTQLPNEGALVCTAGQARGLFDLSCPTALPSALGMSVLLTSPAYLLAGFAFVPARLRQLDRATVGAGLAVVAIAFVNLMHFSQGWVQFGYRFSNDFVPFALILVALGASRLGRWWPILGVLVAASIAINLWGVVWGVMLGW